MACLAPRASGEARKEAALLGMCVTTLQAMAQAAPDTGRLMQHQERLRLPEPARRVPLPTLDEPVPPLLQAAAELRVRLTGFRFSRNTLFSAATLAKPLADLIGQELSLADLKYAAARITACYREKWGQRGAVRHDHLALDTDLLVILWRIFRRLFRIACSFRFRPACACPGTDGGGRLSVLIRRALAGV